jgi:hypothetical protein
VGRPEESEPTERETPAGTQRPAARTDSFNWKRILTPPGAAAPAGEPVGDSDAYLPQARATDPGPCVRGRS